MPTELALSAWSNFYVIVGSASAALTGLQFVVVALAADRRTITPAGAQTFATPTVFHFCAVFFMSAVFSAPWMRLWGPAIGIRLCGVAGLVYTAIIARQARRQTDYKPVFEDWLWHFAIPFLTYVGLFLAAVAVVRHPRPSLFAIGLLQLVLMFAGIHNAWDSAVYIAIDNAPPPERR